MPPAKKTTARPAAKKKPQAPAKKAPAKQVKTQTGATPQMGGGALRASAAAFTTTNIAGPSGSTPGVEWGAHDSGDTMAQIKRNMWLNTLNVEDRAKAMNAMGYWSGGKPVTSPGKYSGSVPTDMKPGAKYQPWDPKTGAFYGTFTQGEEGTKPTYDPLYAGGSGKGKKKPTTKKTETGSRSAGSPTKKSGRLTGKAKRPSSPGGKKVTPKERKAIRAAKGPKGFGGAEAEMPEAAPAAGDSFGEYAEADTTSTSMLRSHGKAYAASREGTGGGRRGGESEKQYKEQEEAPIEESGGRKKKRPRKRVTRKRNKRGNVVVRTRRGGKVVKKRVIKK